MSRGNPSEREFRRNRFSNLDVLNETEGVAEAIWGEVQRLRDDAPLERRDGATP